ncbi:hypothetical protein [Escherichia coli]|uniref:hypothetical protein n=1 Tax=Escherichia coli TaxID=562 RepID=UPI0028757DF2|nr:hypothetical protein [Escherichia coli]
MFAGKKSAQIREILISESAWEEMTCLFAPSQALKAPSYTFAPVINFNPELQVNAEVPLTIESDTGRLSEFIDFKSKASSAEFSKLLTLGVMSGGSTY